jgi:hypothetical protein
MDRVPCECCGLEADMYVLIDVTQIDCDLEYDCNHDIYYEYSHRVALCDVCYREYW